MVFHITRDNQRVGHKEAAEMLITTHIRTGSTYHVSFVLGFEERNFRGVTDMKDCGTRRVRLEHVWDLRVGHGEVDAVDEETWDVMMEMSLGKGLERHSDVMRSTQVVLTIDELMIDIAFQATISSSELHDLSALIHWLFAR